MRSRFQLPPGNSHTFEVTVEGRAGGLIGNVRSAYQAIQRVAVRDDVCPSVVSVRLVVTSPESQIAAFHAAVRAHRARVLIVDETDREDVLAPSAN